MKKQKLILFIVLVLFAVSLTGSVQASNIFYGKVLEISDRQAVLAYTQLGDTLYFVCDLDKWTCRSNGTTTPDKLDEDDIKGKSDYLSARLQSDLNANRASFITKSPSGRFVAYFTSAKLSEGVRKFSIWDTQTNVKLEGSKNIAYWDLLSEENKLFEFSPDEKRLVYVNDKDGRPMLYYLNLGNLQGTVYAGTKLFSNVYTVSDFTFWDNDRLFFVANRDNPLRWALYLYNFKTKELKKVSKDVSYARKMVKTSKYLVFLRNNYNIVQPTFYEVETGKIKQLPTLTSDRSNNPAWGSTVINFGGVSGVLSRPLGYKKTQEYPLVVWLHGGPYRQTSIAYHPYMSYGVYDEVLWKLRRAGVAVLKIDYHGSYGYGTAFAESIKNNIGKQDVADVLAGIATAKKKMNVDKVYLMGNSYGGYLAQRTVAEKPAEIDGVISINGVTDWYTLIDNIPSSIFNIHFDGPPNNTNQTFYDQASVIDRLDQLKNEKFLIFHSEKDNSVPKRQSDMLYSSLKELGYKNVELINYPGEDHVFAKESSLTDICKRVHAFIGVPDSGRCEK